MSFKTHVLCKVFFAAVVACGLSISCATMAGQTASPHTPRGIVSDWTHHHLLYPQSDAILERARFQEDPRWLQNWYIRHQEAWWPAYHPRHLRKHEHRDWTVPLGIAYFEPLFDSTYSFTIAGQTGFGSLTLSDLGGGDFLATAGTLTVTGGNGIGTYPLYPVGPATEASPSGAFEVDDIFLPSQNPVVDLEGLLFRGSGVEVNLWGNSTDNYSFYVYSAGNYTSSITSPGVVTPDVNPSPDPGGSQAFPAKFVFDVTEAPSCTNDFVAIGIPRARVGAQANIIGREQSLQQFRLDGLLPNQRTDGEVRLRVRHRGKCRLRWSFLRRGSNLRMLKISSAAPFSTS